MDLYTEAAAVLDKFEQKRGSVKSLVFASGFKNIRQLYALVCESLKHRPVLSTVLTRTTSLQQEEELQGQGHLGTVLLYEHLVGKGLGRAGHIRKCIIKHKKAIEETCRELLEEKGVSSLSECLSSQCQRLNKLPIPRYVRVNLLKTTLQDAVAAFQEEGWIWRRTLSLPDFLRDVESLGDHSFGLDPLLPDLLVFPPDTDLHDHPWVTGGSLVLQDRASCFPVHVLSPSQGSTVLDCCAAPGNKTSHAASVMGNTGKIIAYERDAKRMTLLQSQLRRLGVSNARTVHRDFLSVDPHDPQFADVEYVMVDPSCSGSGILSRMEHTHTPGTATDPERLSCLQRFQISILKHALRFPSARRVVYSTCSLHREENEEVVAEVAPQVKDRFRVEAVFAQFPHRGEGDGGDDIAAKCVRTSPERDLTNGFFVACFERVSERGDGRKGEITEEEEEEEETIERSRKRRREEIGEQNGPRGAKRENGHDGETEEKTATISAKQGRKRKRGESSKQSCGEIKEKEKAEKDMAMEKTENFQEGETEGAMEIEEEVATVSGKKRKRKHAETSEQNGSTCFELQTSCLHHLSETNQGTEEDESPQMKKKKKKCKKKKNNLETEQQVETESFEAPHDGDEESRMLSGNEEDPSSRKKCKSKRRKKKLRKEESESFDVTTRSTLEESQGHSDISVNGNAASAKSNSPKGKKRTGAVDSSDHAQDANHADNLSISSATTLSAAPETKKKKKGKKQDGKRSFVTALSPDQPADGNESGENASEKGLSFSLYNGESGLSTPEIQISKETLVERKKKTGKKKKKKQECVVDDGQKMVEKGEESHKCSSNDCDVANRTVENSSEGKKKKKEKKKKERH